MGARRRRWVWVAALFAGAAGTVWWLADSDAPPAVTAEPARPERSRGPAEAPDASGVIAPQRAVEDAGPVAVAKTPEPPDAGLDEQRRIDETMRRWREALAPLFEPQRKVVRSAPVIAVSGEAHESHVDAGVQPSCGDAVERLPLHGPGTIDFVVVVDTSGSMYEELPEVGRWLAELELSLRDSGLDFQLLVVADQRSLYRTSVRRPSDAGYVQVRVSSRDAFEVLIAAAREGPAPRWVERLRPGSMKHVIIVTDDEAADPRGLPYLRPLTEAAGGALGTAEAPGFALDLLGGFEPRRHDQVLLSDEALATQVCFGGVAPGLGYQRVAQVTDGLRASLGHKDSYRALAEALASLPVRSAATSCMWLLRPELMGQTLSEVRAIRGRSVLRLAEARTAEACIGRSEAWRSAGQFFALCASTCAAISDAGYDTIELSTRCER